MRGTAIAILVLALIGAGGHVWRNGGLPELAGRFAGATAVASGADGAEIGSGSDSGADAGGAADAESDSAVAGDGANGAGALGAGTGLAAKDAQPASAAKPSKSVYYQWVDERGSVHFARSLDEVPADWRSRAGQFEVEAPAAKREPTSELASAARPAGKAGAARVRAGRGAARSPRVQRVAAVEPPVSRNHDVTVYTAPWCGWCRKTIAFLDARGVVYENKDIELVERYADELREKSGSSAIPFVEIDGAELHGYDPDGMTRLLGL